MFFREALLSRETTGRKIYFGISVFQNATNIAFGFGGHMVWSGICILTFYLGALNTILARVAGTCTQGDASRLWGVIFSTLFYLLASYALFRTRLFRTSVIACLPVLPKNDWQAWFSIRLLIEVLVFQSAARSVLEGMPFPEDGNETAFATLWPTMSLGVLFVMVLVYLARRRVQ